MSKRTLIHRTVALCAAAGVTVALAAAGVTAQAATSSAASPSGSDAVVAADSAGYATVDFDPAAVAPIADDEPSAAPAGTIAPNDAAAASACAVNAWGHVGYRICGTSYTLKKWTNGHQEYFVIGTDKQIWHIADWMKSWEPMGGTAKSWVAAGYDSYESKADPQGRPTVVTVGTDNREHCRTYTGKSWNTWHPCETRQTVIARAKGWLTADHGHHVPYSMSASFHGWRTDCSGYVSMAWNAKHSGGGYSTETLPGISHSISWKQLRPGDIIGYMGPGSAGGAGHVMIFAGWANASHTEYTVYEQAHSAGGTAHRNHPVSYRGDSPGPYKPRAGNDIIAT
ncbi:MAG: C40 family peptidase [Catenulispora sp.]|nr:C40 family peptidase [Catenulispora sp.]